MDEREKEAILRRCLEWAVRLHGTVAALWGVEPGELLIVIGSKDGEVAMEMVELEQGGDAPREGG